MISQFLNRMLALKLIKFGEEGGITVFGRRAVIIPADFLVKLYVDLEKRVDAKTAKEVLYNAGKNHTTAGASKYLKFRENLRTLFEKVSITGDPAQEFAQRILKVTGWGELKLISNRDKKILLVVDNSPIANAYLEEYGISKEPVCHYIAGLICGALNVIKQRDYNCTEINCLSTGKSKNCVFVAKEI